MRKYISIIIFILLFIAIISTVSILIARGYNFTNSELRENGILSISSIPEGATIYINDEKKATSPEKIELVSGTYEIELVHDTYTSWKKQINVEPLITKEISVTLYPENLSIEQITFASIDKVFYSQDGDFALYTTVEDPSSSIWLVKLEKSIFDISSSEPRKIADTSFLPEECLSKSTYSINISEDNEKALITCSLSDYSTFYLLDLKKSNVPPLNINRKINFNPKLINFAFNSETLLISDDEITSVFNIRNEDLILIARKNYGTVELTTFGKAYLLLEYNYDGEKKNLVNLDADLTKESLVLTEINPTEILKISGSVENKDVFAYTTETSSAVCNLKQSSSEPSKIFSNNPVEILSWSPDGQSFLFIEENTLKSLTITHYPDESYKLIVNTLIGEYDTSLYTVLWSHNSNKILIYDLSKGQLSSIDTDGTNLKLLYKGEVSNQDSFYLSKNETFLIILLKDTNNFSNLYSVKLKV